MTGGAELDEDLRLLCAAVALSIIAVSEIRKAVLRRQVGRGAGSDPGQGPSGGQVPDEGVPG
jgi:hypothetical protein